MRYSLTALIASVLIGLLLAGCSGGNGDANGGVNSDDSADPQRWFEDECSLQLSTTSAPEDDTFAIKQAALVPNPEDIDSDKRDLTMSVYSYDDSTAGAEKIGSFDKDHPVCFRAGAGEVVTATDSDSGEETEFYEVETPDGTAYVANFGLDFSSDKGLYYNADSGEIGEGYNIAPLEVSELTPVDDEAKRNANDEAIDVEDLEGNESIPG